MDDDLLPVTRRGIMKIAGVGAVGGVASAGAGRELFDSGSAACEAVTPRRPVWVANNAASSSSVPSGQYCRSDEPDLGLNGYVTQSLQYHGSEWVGDSLFGDEGRGWKHHFQLTTLALGTATTEECDGVFPHEGVTAVETEISIPDARCERRYDASVSWAGELAPNVMDVETGTAFLEDRDQGAPDPCFCSTTEFPSVHREQQFQGALHEFARAAQDHEGSLDPSEFAGTVSAAVEHTEDHDYSDEFEEALVSAFVLGASLGLRYAHPTGAAAATAVQVGAVLLDAYDAWQARNRQAEEDCDLPSLTASHETDGGASTVKVQQLAFTVKTDVDWSDVTLDRTDVPVRIQTTAGFEHPSDRTLEWSLDVDAPGESRAGAAGTDYSVPRVGDLHDRRNLASLDWSEPEQHTSPEVTAPSPNLHPTIRSRAPLDGSEWPLGSRPEYALDVDDGQPLQRYKQALDPTPEGSTNDGPYCDQWHDEPATGPDVAFRHDELGGEPRQGGVGVFVQNDAGLTGFHVEEFDVVEAPEARIAEPSGDTLALDGSVDLDAGGSEALDGSEIVEYRWDLLERDESHPERSSRLRVAEGETGELSGHLAALHRQRNLLLELTVVDDEGREGVARRELTVTGDWRSHVSDDWIRIDEPSAGDAFRVGEELEFDVSMGRSLIDPGSHGVDPVKYVVRLEDQSRQSPRGGSGYQRLYNDHDSTYEDGWVESGLSASVALDREFATAHPELTEWHTYGPEPPSGHGVEPGEYELVVEVLGMEARVPVTIEPEVERPAIRGNWTSGAVADYVTTDQQLELEGTGVGAGADDAFWLWSVGDVGGLASLTADGAAKSTLSVPGTDLSPGPTQVSLHVLGDVQTRAATHTLEVVEPDYEPISVSIDGPRSPDPDERARYTADVDDATGDASFTWRVRPLDEEQEEMEQEETGEDAWRQLPSTEASVEYAPESEDPVVLEVTATDRVDAASAEFALSPGEDGLIDVDVEPGGADEPGKSLVSLDASEVGEDLDVDRYEWSIYRRSPDGEAEAEVATPSGVAPEWAATSNRGGYRAAVRAIADDDAATASTLFVVPPLEGPTAAATGTVEAGGGEGDYESAVHLDAAGSEPGDLPIDSYEWTIYQQSPDGEAESVVDDEVTGESPTWAGPHARGGYRAELVVTDTGGALDVAEVEFTFPEVRAAPTAAATSDVDAGGGDGVHESSVTLDATASEPGEGPIEAYDWTIYRLSPDGEARAEVASPDGASVSWEGTPNRGGYEAVVTVEDDDGRIDTAETSFGFPAIDVERPSASATSSVDAGAGSGRWESQVTLDATGTESGTADVASYDWTIYQLSPDGEAEAKVDSVSGAYTTWDGPHSRGGYRADLVVEDDAGLTAVASTSFSFPEIEVEGPTADASSSVAEGAGSGQFESRVTLDASGSEPGTAPIESYEWTIYQLSPDGSHRSEVDTRSGATPTWDGAHNRGGYEAVLTVRDSNQRTDTATTSFVLPSIDVEGPTAAASSSVAEGAGSGQFESRVTLDASGSEAGTASIESYDWTIYRLSPDGSQRSKVTTRSGTTASWEGAHHRGGYEAVLTVRDSNQRTDTATTSFVLPSIEVEGPTASASSSVNAGGGSGRYESRVHLDATGSESGTASITDYDWTIYQLSPDGSARAEVATRSGATASWDGAHHRGGYEAVVTVEDDNQRTDAATTSFTFPQVDSGGSDDGSGGSSDGGSSGGGSDDGSTSDGGSDDGGDEPDWCDEDLDHDTSPGGTYPDYSQCN